MALHGLFQRTIQSVFCLPDDVVLSRIGDPGILSTESLSPRYFIVVSLGFYRSNCLNRDLITLSVHSEGVAFAAQGELVAAAVDDDVPSNIKDSPRRPGRLDREPPQRELLERLASADSDFGYPPGVSICCGP